jgi:hypothetical protein
MEQRDGAKRSWWSAGEALVWVAFRQFALGGNWCGLPDYRPRRDWSVLPEGERFARSKPKDEQNKKSKTEIDDELGQKYKEVDTEWLTTAPSLIAALAAVAGEKPWKPDQPPLLYSPETYSSAAQRLVQETGLDARVLAAELSEDVERGVRAQEALSGAEFLLSRAVGTGEVQAVGRPVADLVDLPRPSPLEPIPTLPFCGYYPLIIDIEGATRPAGVDVVDYQGWSWWVDVELNAADLQAHFAAPANTDETSTGAESPIKAKRRSSNNSYDKQDAPLLDEMEQLIANGEAENLYQAALKISEKAPGSRHTDSTAKRLLKKYANRSALKANERTE